MFVAGILVVQDASAASDEGSTDGTVTSEIKCEATGGGTCTEYKEMSYKRTIIVKGYCTDGTTPKKMTCNPHLEGSDRSKADCGDAKKESGYRKCQCDNWGIKDGQKVEVVVHCD